MEKTGNSKTKLCLCACGKEWHRPNAVYCYNCGAKLEEKRRKTTLR